MTCIGVCGEDLSLLGSVWQGTCEAVFFCGERPNRRDEVVLDCDDDGQLLKRRVISQLNIPGSIPLWGGGASAVIGQDMKEQIQTQIK